MRSVLPLLFLTLATPALASDGVLEINQTCAVQTGCFSGDSAGLPVTITRSGSYVSTSDLNTGGIAGGPGNLNGIAVSASDVTLDLGGFSVSCRNIFPPQACGGGTGIGVVATSDAVENLSLRKGTIRGMGSDGIRLAGQHHLVDDVRVIGNGGSGIVVTRPTIPNPVGPDLSGDSRSTIRDSTINANELVGVATDAAMLMIDGCTILGNEIIDINVTGLFTGNVWVRDSVALSTAGNVNSLGGNSL